MNQGIRRLQDKQIKLIQARAKANLQVKQRAEVTRRAEEMLKWLADEVEWIKYMKEVDMEQQQLVTCKEPHI